MDECISTGGAYGDAGTDFDYNARDFDDYEIDE